MPGSYSVNVAGEQETGELLMFGEWMSGCPEKGEQGWVACGRLFVKPHG